MENSSIITRTRFLLLFACAKSATIMLGCYGRLLGHIRLVTKVFWVANRTFFMVSSAFCLITRVARAYCVVTMAFLSGY